MIKLDDIEYQILSGTLKYAVKLEVDRIVGIGVAFSVHGSSGSAVIIGKTENKIEAPKIARAPE